MPATGTFALPENARAKAAAVGPDLAHFARIAETLDHRRSETAARLDTLRRLPAGLGESAVERDAEIRRLSRELRLLERYGLDLCLGRMTPADGGEPIYIGRAGLRAADGELLLVDWRAPAAEPYFAATLEHPHGIVSRRRYRWAGGRVLDFWDEALTEEGFSDAAALDDQSAFIASLGSARSARMRDVLATIQADQDAIIRRPSAGALVVDGGPGTGKTVVALHRAAHLIYAEPRLTEGGGGVLLVGPNAHYLAYVDDVLPSLGEDSVRLCTLRDLVPEGAGARVEEGRSAAVKASLDPVAVIAAAVADAERPPRRALRLASPWGDMTMTRADWGEAFDRADPVTPHNDARDEVWEAVLEILTDQLDDPDVPVAPVRRWLRAEEELTDAVVAAWPIVSPTAVVARLWSDPGFVARCAPHLSPAEVAAVQRADASAWTVADLPFLDAARRRIGDPEAVRRERRRRAEVAAAQQRMADVVDDLIAADDGDLKLMSMLREKDAQNVLLGVDAPSVAPPDELAGPFAHIVVDEAQELTDAEWRMLLARCPSRSFTIVGDRAQARHGFFESWTQRLGRVGIPEAQVAHLSVNYRTPREVMEAAAPVIRAMIPDANVPTSVRSTGVPVTYAAPADRDRVLAEWAEEHPEGIACVIGDAAFAPTARVRSLTPEGAKGLEFDLVVLVRPDDFGDGVAGAVDRYVAMTRTTGRLVVLTET